jgi:hypothetical protein
MDESPVAYPKRQYVRSKKLLKLVSELDCQLCGFRFPRPGGPHQLGRGQRGGIKSDDNLVAALCMFCHHEIDQGAKWSKHERQQAWWLAHRKTVEFLVETNQWPVDVPLPDEREWERLIDSCQTSSQL